MNIFCLSINSEDNLSGVPKWEYSLAFAYLQAYYTTSNYYSETTFIKSSYYEGVDIREVIHDIIENKPDILCVSTYVWNTNKILLIVDEIKKHLKDLKIIMGGPEFSFESESQLTGHPAIDIIVVGEGEKTFKELIDYYFDKGHLNELSDIKGIIFRDHYGIIHRTTKRENIQNLNEIPSPYLTGIVDLDKLKNKLVAIETQRGCINNCGYCNYQKGNTSLRFFELERIEKEIELILSSRPKQLYLMDPTFNSNIKRAKQILNYIIKSNKNTVINAEMIPDLLDDEIIILSKLAGMRTVEIGIQSLNPEALKIMGRYRNEEKLFKNIHSAIEAGLYLIPQIIVGLPGDSTTGFFDTFNRVYDLPTEELDILMLLILPQTRYRQEAEKYGIKFSPEAPYKIKQSNNFPIQDIEMIEKFIKIVLVTQLMKIKINKINKKLGLQYHELFLEFIRKIGNRLQNFSWPIHSETDKNIAIDTVEKFYFFYLDKLNNSIDEYLQNELFQQKRKTKFLLAARYMNLSENKKIIH